MGSSKPQTVEYTLPSAEAIKKAGLGARQFLQVTPEESFQLAGEYGKYLEDRTRYAKELSDRAFGSSSERGALDLERNAARELAYAASLPRGDAYISGSSSGGSYDTEENDPYKQIRDLTQTTYARMLADAAEKRAYADSGASQPYNPVFEKLASGGYEGPYPVSQRRVDTLRVQRRRRRQQRRNALA